MQEYLYFLLNLGYDAIRLIKADIGKEKNKKS